LGLGAKELVDSLRGGSGGALAFAATLIGFNAIASASSGWMSTTISTTLEEKTDHWLERQIASACAAVPDLSAVDDPRFQDELHILLNQRGTLGGAITTLVSTLSLVVRLLVSEILLFSVSPTLSIIPLLMFVVAIAVSGQSEALLGKARNEVAEVNRVANNLFQTASNPSASREICVYNLGPELARRHHEAMRHSDKIMLKARFSAAIREIAAWFAYGLAFAAVIFLVIRRDHSLTAGDLALVFILIVQLVGQVQGAGMVVSALVRQSQIFAHFESIVESTKLVKESATNDNPPVRLENSIEFRNVSLLFPHSTMPAISNVNMTFEAGSVIALLGSNGAGKSTIVNLLLKLLVPTSGAIYVDGRPLSSINSVAWRSISSGGFQDFCRFELRLQESIGVGDLPRRLDREAASVALKRAGSESLVGQIRCGLDAMIGRSAIDGVELSEGQWQKVAVARSMMREAPLLFVFDEPTASLDPEAERDVFDQVLKRTREIGKRYGTITIFVSHRYLTVQRADLILLIEGGKIIEQGNHQELLQIQGTYAQRFEMQAAGYR
jgi:ATP-binding cassette subfamily B protein